MLCFTDISAQGNVVAQDSISLFSDSVTTTADTLKKPKKSVIDAVITYQATDSIVFFSNGKGFLYGQGTVNYQEIELKADYIEMDMDSAQVYARGVADSTGTINGNPVFKDGGESYESRSIKYNFDTKKGYITHVVTQQGEGYIVGERTKKTEDDLMYMQDGRYTTCDNHEHPHFYLNLTKAKVKPKSWIVTGPAYLVLEDVPLPLAIPFGYFPFTDKYSSGVLMPSYGDEMTRGFFLRDGGYYLAISDYFDLALTGDIYTKGSWAVRGASTYVKRYRFNGNFNVNFAQNVVGEKDLPNSSKSNDFSVNWRHSQDPKANIYRTLSADVRFSTSSYKRNDVSTYYSPNQANTTSSSIAYTQRFPDSPWTITANLTANQRTSDSTVNVLPSLNFAMSRISPFKRKNAAGKERWYEKIYLTYNSAYTGSILSKEDSIKHYIAPKKWENNNFKQNAAISSSFTLFRYINISPSINYSDNFLFSGRTYEYAKRDTNNIKLGDVVYQPRVSGGVSAQTKFYGFFKPLIGKKINMIRWVLSPSTGLSYSPGAGGFKYGEAWKNSALGAAGNVNFSLDNNVEMKWAGKDSTGEELLKKISLIDNLGLSASYNLMADSFNMSNINANLRLKFTDKFGISLSGSFDPYEYDWDNPTSHRRLPSYRWEGGRAPQFLGTSTSFGYSISNDTFKKKDKKKDEKTIDEKTEDKSLLAPKKDERDLDTEGYTKFSLPWTLGFDYNLRCSRKIVGRQDSIMFANETREKRFKMEFTHDISLNASLTLTPKWRMSGSMNCELPTESKKFQITYTTLNITRDLHCWSLTANLVPFGVYQSYMVTIRVNASMLQDLKYEQRGNSYQSAW
ncbi:hypothetical protein FACS189434_00870 [Bacteroidia bacterium]|nr:hypothetical protein FACS189434_00870 [Bacteroidia bacterium]